MTTLEGNFITYWPDDDPKNEDGLLATIYNHYDYLKKLAKEKDNLKTVHRWNSVYLNFFLNVSFMRESLVNNFVGIQIVYTLISNRGCTFCKCVIPFLFQATHLAGITVILQQLPQFVNDNCIWKGGFVRLEEVQVKISLYYWWKTRLHICGSGLLAVCLQNHGPGFFERWIGDYSILLCLMFISLRFKIHLLKSSFACNFISLIWESFVEFCIIYEFYWE